MRWRVAFLLDEYAPMIHAHRKIETQQRSSCASDRRSSNDLCADEYKVIVPHLHARVEQWRDLMRIGINRSKVCAFVAIARETG